MSGMPIWPFHEANVLTREGWGTGDREHQTPAETGRDAARGCLNPLFKEAVLAGKLKTEGEEEFLTAPAEPLRADDERRQRAIRLYQGEEGKEVGEVEG